MKVQTTFRTLTVLAVFSAALSITSSAYAQEVENSVWQDSPVLALNEPVPDRPSATATSPAELTPSSADAKAAAPAATVNKASLTSESTNSEWPPAEGRIAGVLLVCIAAVLLYLLSESRRTKRNIYVRTGRGGEWTKL